jgi:hypothetical protein
MALNLLKIAVGIDSVAHLARVQKARRAERRALGVRAVTWHFTRNRPRKTVEILDGGSLYWIIKGEIVARQRILAFEEATGRRGRKRCAIRLAAEIVRTVPQPHRAIQGWRYLPATDAPDDLKDAAPGAAARLPEGMARELRELGLI